MTHLSMEQLLAIREPGLEPQVRSWGDHLETCPACRAESDRLDQRTAQLKALPTLAPGRDLFLAVREKVARERRLKQLRRVAFAGLAVAASVTIAFVSLRHQASQERTLVAADPELAEVMSQSKGLERAIEGLDQDRQVVDGRTVAVTTSLEDQLARVDRQIEAVGLMDQQARQQQMLKLWRERVGLLDALVDVHLTGARYVGF